MATKTENGTPKILILATLSGGYRGADSTGQAHLEYPPNTFILPVMSAAMFPESFYMRAFERGFDGILVMYSGTDSPYKGAPERTATMVNSTYELMKERNLDPRRLRLTAICTVCVRPFLEEIEKMNQLLEELGPVPRSLPATTALQA
ncbi:MAG: hydrogenase iron-sulfur subunit [Chloroflexota bacterium]|nr:hydrogenase iron-sulfur subunit [Chloroflexota bacterium]